MKNKIIGIFISAVILFAYSSFALAQTKESTPALVNESLPKLPDIPGAPPAVAAPAPMVTAPAAPALPAIPNPPKLPEVPSVSAKKSEEDKKEPDTKKEEKLAITADAPEKKSQLPAIPTPEDKKLDVKEIGMPKPPAIPAMPVLSTPAVQTALPAITPAPTPLSPDDLMKEGLGLKKGTAGKGISLDDLDKELKVNKPKKRTSKLAPTDFDYKTGEGASSSSDNKEEIDTYEGAAHAAASNNVDSLKSYLSSKKSINIKYNGIPLICYAAEYGARESIRLLISKKTKVNAQCFNGETPLTLALTAADEESASMLIKAGASTNVENSNGSTPLMLAALAGFDELSMQMVKNEKLIRKTDGSGKSALHYAAGAGLVRLVNYLTLDSVSINQQDIMGGTPLMYAANYKRAEVAYMLVERGADKTIQDNYGRTAASLAQAAGDVELANFLAQPQ